MKPDLHDKYIGYAVDRMGNTWELYQQSHNLYIGAIISDAEQNAYERPEWFVITKGVLEVM